MIKVHLYHSPTARQVLEEELELDSGSTVAQALLSLQHVDSALFLSNREAKPNTVSLKLGYQVAVWSKPTSLDRVLKPFDRIEVLRPIKVDPKVARRERFKKQGAKAAGLFAKQRPGAKAGY